MRPVPKFAELALTQLTASQKRSLCAYLHTRATHCSSAVLHCTTLHCTALHCTALGRECELLGNGPGEKYQDKSLVSGPPLPRTASLHAVLHCTYVVCTMSCCMHRKLQRRNSLFLPPFRTQVSAKKGVSGLQGNYTMHMPVKHNLKINCDYDEEKRPLS